MGSKNHEVVPCPLIVQVSGLRNGGVNKILGVLAKRNLVGKVQNSKCMFFLQGLRPLKVTIEQMMGTV
jgi:RIO-like serine/threonine protein kinase